MPVPVLVTIRPGVQFRTDAAASWLRMEAKVGRPIKTNSTYRDWNKQYLLWKHWEETHQPPRALHPDQSMHCKGLAADTPEVSLLKSLEDYGWKQTALDEDWHFEYDPTRDKHYGEPAGGGSKPLPIPVYGKRDSMILLYGPDSQSPNTPVLVVAGPGGIWDRYANSTHRANLISQFGNPVVLDLNSMKSKEAYYKGLAPQPVKVEVTAKAVN